MVRLIGGVALVFGMVVLGSVTSAAPVTWFGPSQAANSNATWTVGGSYGVVFQTGGSGTFAMDWLTIGLNTSASATSGSGTLVVELRNTTNSTAYSAVAGTTLYATDTISFSSPLTAATNFFATMSAADFPNISGYDMAASTAYALTVSSPSAGYGILRTTGYANGTTNDFYTVNDGFTALDTLRNNTANYTNTTNSYPTLSIAFGATAVPEPALSGAVIAGLGGMWWRRRRPRS